MTELIASASRVPVPGGKVIDEYVGRLNSGETAISVAHMVAPGGWEEPAQTPDFDEYTLVLRGSLRVEHPGGVTRRGRRAGRGNPGGGAHPLHDADGRRCRIRRDLPARVRPGPGPPRRVEARSKPSDRRMWAGGLVDRLVVPLSVPAIEVR